jgi:hypothetical protein
MQNKKRELVLKDSVQKQEQRARASNKRIQTGERYHYCTVALLWITLFCYTVGIGMTLLYFIG